MWCLCYIHIYSTSIFMNMIYLLYSNQIESNWLKTNWIKSIYNIIIYIHYQMLSNACKCSCINVLVTVFISLVGFIYFCIFMLVFHIIFIILRMNSFLFHDFFQILLFFKNFLCMLLIFYIITCIVLYGTYMYFFLIHCM